MTHAELIAALHKDPGNHDILRALAMLASQAGDSSACNALTTAEITAYKIRMYRQNIECIRAEAAQEIAGYEDRIRERRRRCPHPIRDGNLCLCCGYKE